MEFHAMHALLTGEHGLREIVYHTTLQNDNLELKSKYDGCYLVCEAYIPEEKYNDEYVNRSLVQLDVRCRCSQFVC